MAEASKNTLDDLELVKRAKENDSRAFEKLAKSCRCISKPNGAIRIVEIAFIGNHREVQRRNQVACQDLRQTDPVLLTL